MEKQEFELSVTYSVKSPKGFPVLFNIKSNEKKGLFEALGKLEDNLIEAGYTPDERKSYYKGKKKEEKKPELVGRKCPKCGADLVYAYKKDGTKFIKCSTNKWDWKTKKATGCDYVEWDIEQDKKQEAGDSFIQDLEAGQNKPATAAQKAIIKQKAPEVYKEDMSYADALIILENIK